MKMFDNVIIRNRDEQCLFISTGSQINTAYWPNINQIAFELDQPQVNRKSIQQPPIQKGLLIAMANKDSRLRSFLPQTIGFRFDPKQIGKFEACRKERVKLIFHGIPARKLIGIAIEEFAVPLSAGGIVELRFPQLTSLIEDNSILAHVVSAANQLFLKKKIRADIMVCPQNSTINEEIWKTIYHCPNVRIGWLAEEVAGIDSTCAWSEFLAQSPRISRLHQIAEQGLWVHTIVPASQHNTNLLPDIADDLATITRGGSLEIVPAPFLDLNQTYAPPEAKAYAEILLEIYRRNAQRLSHIEPFAWVKARLDSSQSMTSSHANAGAELSILANGDVYPGEGLIGREEWLVGNLLSNPESLRLERLDAAAETWLNQSKPAACGHCDWRFHCGGVDCSVQHLQERSRQASEQESLFDLYCAPRKALFEEMLWDSVLASAIKGSQSRDKLRLREDCIEFEPTTLT